MQFVDLYTCDIYGVSKKGLLNFSQDYLNLKYDGGFWSVEKLQSNFSKKQYMEPCKDIYTLYLGIAVKKKHAKTTILA
jgi:hypothetical protein